MINVFGLIGLKNYSRPFLDNNVIFVLTLILKSISISLSGFYAQRDLSRPSVVSVSSMSANRFVYLYSYCPLSRTTTITTACKRKKRSVIDDSLIGDEALPAPSRTKRAPRESK